VPVIKPQPNVMTLTHIYIYHYVHYICNAFPLLSVS